MAANKVYLYNGPRGQHRCRGEFASANATLYYMVECDPGDLPHVAEAAIPYSFGQYLEGDIRGRFCTGIEPQFVEESNTAYIVAVEFSNTGGPFVTDPLSQVFPPEMDFENNNETMYVDGNGNALLNSAGSAFDPPLSEDIADSVFIFKMNMATLRASLMKQYANAVNTDALAGAQPGELKILPPTSVPMVENGVPFFQETWKVVQRPNRKIGGQQIRGWDRLVLDEGRYRLPTDNEQDDTSDVVKLIAIPDQNGDPTSDPVKLDGSGQPLDPKNPPTSSGGGFVVSSDGQSVFRIVPPRNLQPFAPLKFNTSTVP